MRIAVVSHSGTDIDEHFGKAREFLIYDMVEGKAAFVAKRAAPPLSSGDRSHGFDEAKFREIADVLKDCKRVYAVRIGDRPKMELEKMGIETVLHEGPIADVTA